MKTEKLISKLMDNHIKYNQEVDNYEENGEEDFLEWFKMELQFYETKLEDENLNKEKFECMDCGCYFWVNDRNDFECPNCEYYKELKKNKEEVKK